MYRRMRFCQQYLTQYVKSLIYVKTKLLAARCMAFWTEAGYSFFFVLSLYIPFIGN